MEIKEGALILACVRAHYDASVPADLARYRSDEIRWPNVLTIARRHGIVPLVYDALKTTCLPDFAANTFRVLQREFRESAANSFLYAAELVRLFKYLDERGIPTLVFKGPSLALLLYGKLSLRTVRDLDLLVERGQFEPALHALQKCGYEPVGGLGGEPPSVSGSIRKHILLVHRALGFAVELHWALAEGSFVFPLRFDQIWAERQMIMVIGQPVATLSREHLLLLMCAHGTNHCWGSLKWIRDIAQAVLAFRDLNWNYVFSCADTLGCQRMLSVGLALAEDLCGVQLPAEVRPLIHSEKVNRICCEVKTGLFVEREPIVNLDRTLSFVRSRERLLDRIRILLRFIGPELRPNARDRALIHLPARLEVLYFPLRLVRLLLFCWRRAILPMLRGALDRTPIRHFSPIPPR